MTQNPYLENPIKTGSLEPVRTAALWLMVLASISIAMMGLSVVFDLALIASGFIDALSERSGQDELPSVIFRMIWAVVLEGTNLVILVGAMKMRNLQSYSLAYTSAVLSVIPCLGPCCILGVPFGIWALVLLHREDVKHAFT